MKTKERDFNGQARGSSSIMVEDVTPQQVRQFMETSFYLPVDILKHPEWVVDKIKVISGEEFSMHLQGFKWVHCFEDAELLAASQFVAISHRYNIKSKESFTVAKIWYGAPK